MIWSRYLALGLWLAPGAAAQALEPQAAAAPETGWANTIDLGLSATVGNSETEAFNLRNLLEWRSERSRFRFKLEGLRSNTADDRFRQVDPGFSWEPGASPPEVTSSLVRPDQEPEVEKYYAEARYERSLSRTPPLGRGTMSWHGGASWDRNLDAGLRSRLVVFAGVGHRWWDSEDLKFHTIYSLSWTDRDEETPDPEKKERFFGLRSNWLFEHRWSKHVTYHNDWTFNAELDDFSDYSSNMTSSISVTASKRTSLKVSLQWLYNSVPALEDIDLIAEVVFVDPDGIPGNGDELIQTVGSGGAELVVGSVRERKEKLDTVFSTSLVIKF